MDCLSATKSQRLSASQFSVKSRLGNLCERCYCCDSNGLQHTEFLLSVMFPAGGIEQWALLSPQTVGARQHLDSRSQHEAEICVSAAVAAVLNRLSSMNLLFPNTFLAGRKLLHDDLFLGDGVKLGRRVCWKTRHLQFPVSSVSASFALVVFSSLVFGTGSVCPLFSRVCWLESSSIARRILTFHS